MNNIAQDISTSASSEPIKEIGLKQLFLIIKEDRTWPPPRPVLAVVNSEGMQILRDAHRSVLRDTQSVAQAMAASLCYLDLCGGVMVWTYNHLQRDEVRTYYTWGEAYEDLKDLMGAKDVGYLKIMAAAERESKHGPMRPE